MNENKIKISLEYPPNFAIIKAEIPELKEYQPVFSYGDTLFNPFQVTLTADVIEHEIVHTKQQSKFPEIWWVKYLKDPAFRLDQEVEAYRHQYKFAKKYIKDREVLNWLRLKIADSLSSSLYGNLITKVEALHLIK
jgi:hypothetical protein